MSFFDTILDLGKTALNYLKSDGIGSALARTALTGFALSQLSKSVSKSNDAVTAANQTPKEVGAKIVITPDQNNRIPVFYGRSFLPGIVTDAHISTDQTTMTYVYTLAELTGTQLSDGAETQYTFNDVYLNDQRVVFKSDGITVNQTIDRDGNQDASLRDLVTIRFYAGGSESSFQTQQIGGYSITPADAYDVVPNWTVFHGMYKLVFAVITVIYNAEKGLKTLPQVLFDLESSMQEPGDCIYDYLLSTRYGAGLALEDIFDE